MAGKSKMSLYTGQHKIIDQLKELEQKGVNLLLPSTMIFGFQGVYTPSIETVELSPDPEDKDVYWNKVIKKFSVTGVGLEKISICGNIIWNIPNCKPIERISNYVSYQAVGGIYKADGSLYQKKTCADLDMLTFREDLVEKYNSQKFKADYKKYHKDASPTQDHIDYCTNRDFRQKRSFMLEQTETKAYNRLTRFLLSVKQGYTKQEMEKPFVVLRFSLELDMSDPMIKQMIAKRFLGSSSLIYGGQKQDTAAIIDIDPVAPPEAEPEPEPEPKAKPKSKPDQEPDDGIQPDGFDPEMTRAIEPKKVKNAVVESFEGLSDADQCESLEKVMERKAYKRESDKALSDYSAIQRAKFFSQLMDMPDASAGESIDEIPF